MSGLPPSPRIDGPVRRQRMAGERAVEFVRSGMAVGLGAGTTARFAMRRLAEKLREGQLHEIVGIPCSTDVGVEARRLGIHLVALEDRPVIDVTIDGADEVDPAFNLIKGGGGALLREKIVAQASRREVIVVDEGKLSSVLGTRWPVPVEVVSFGWRSQAQYLESLGARVSVRHTQDGSLYFTDQSNLILDCDFGPIGHLAELARQLSARAGIVEHGLFLALATDLIVASDAGVRHLTPVARRSAGPRS